MKPFAVLMLALPEINGEKITLARLAAEDPRRAAVWLEGHAFGRDAQIDRTRNLATRGINERQFLVTLTRNSDNLGDTGRRRGPG